MQIIYFEFSCIFMKTIEMTKKVQKNQGAILTKLLISLDNCPRIPNMISQ